MKAGDLLEQVTQARLRHLRLILQCRDPELTSDALRVSVVVIHGVLFTCWRCENGILGVTHAESFLAVVERGCFGTHWGKGNPLSHSGKKWTRSCVRSL